MMQTKFISALRNQNGLSLIQVMIAAAIMGILTMSFMSMLSYQQKSAVAAQTVVSRNLLQIQLQQSLINSGAIAQTLAYTGAAGNVSLASCLKPSGNSCVQTSTPTGFYLYGADGKAIAGAGPTAPILYDYQGNPCTTPSPQCLFQVFTTYSATCPLGSPCGKPVVTATYTIQQAPKINPVGGTPLKPFVSPAIPMSISGLSDIEIVTSPEGMGDGTNTHRASYCPPGKIVVGGGCLCDAAQSYTPEPILYASFPFANGTGWYCRCNKPTIPGQYVAMAICVTKQ